MSRPCGALWATDGASFAGEFVNSTRSAAIPSRVAKSVPIVIGGHSEAAARRAGRLGDGFFPSIGAQGRLPCRCSTSSAVRPSRPAAIRRWWNWILGCPVRCRIPVPTPARPVEERIARGAGRLALPVTAFLPDLETTLARFGEEIIGPYADA